MYQTGKGKGNALRAGFAAATGEIIAAIDADGSMDPTELYSHVGALMAGADLVKGSRFMQGGRTTDMEPHRRLGNFGLMLVARLFFGGRYSDLCYGYFAFWRRCLEDLHPDVDGFEIETLINIRALKARLARGRGRQPRGRADQRAKQPQCRSVTASGSSSPSSASGAEGAAARR